MEAAGGVDEPASHAPSNSATDNVITFRRLAEHFIGSILA
jgi:hypothetical protein